MHCYSQLGVETESNGQAVMAGTSFNTYYVLNAIGLLLFAFVLLKSPNYRKVIGGFELAAELLMIVPSSASQIGMIFSLLSLLPWIAFITLLLGVFRKAAKTGNKP